MKTIESIKKAIYIINNVANEGLTEIEVNYKLDFNEIELNEDIDTILQEIYNHLQNSIYTFHKLLIKIEPF